MVAARTPLTLFAEPAAPPPTVKLADYDWIVVNSSAGKDSQAMLDVIAEKARAEGVTDRVVVVHADLGRCEWPGVKELAEEQAKHYGFRFEVVRRTKGDILQQVRDRAAALKAKGKVAPPWPSSDNRWCTSDQKRDQVSILFTALVKGMGPREKGRPARVLNCLGMRADESPARAKLMPFGTDERATNGKRHVDRWLPIHQWTTEEVWARIKKAGTRHHYAYDLGMPRLSCVFCIFAPLPALMLAGKHNPGLLDEYCTAEEEVGSKFKADLSLTEVRAMIARGEEPGEIRTWAM